MRRPITYYLVSLFALVLFGCSHLRPPDDYSWNDRSGDPGEFDRALATQLDFQHEMNDNISRKVNRDFNGYSSGLRE